MFLSKLKLSRAKLEMFGAIICAVVAAGGIFWWMVHFADYRQDVEVVVAANDLRAPRVLAASDFKIITLPRGTLPSTVIGDRDATLGKMLLHSLSANQLITTGDLIQDRNPNSESALVPGGKVGFVLPAGWLVSGFPKVSKNDVISIYAAFTPSKEFPTGSGIVLDHASVLSAVSEKNGSPSQLLLALDPSAAARILQAHAGGYKLAAVVEYAGASLQGLNINIPASAP